MNKFQREIMVKARDVIKLLDEALGRPMKLEASSKPYPYTEVVEVPPGKEFSSIQKFKDNGFRAYAKGGGKIAVVIADRDEEDMMQEIANHLEELR